MGHHSLVYLQALKRVPRGISISVVQEYFLKSSNIDLHGGTDADHCSIQFENPIVCFPPSVQPHVPRTIASFILRTIAQ